MQTRCVESSSVVQVMAHTEYMNDIKKEVGAANNIKQVMQPICVVCSEKRTHDTRKV